ncbi:MAG: nucleoside monophosphate kinase [Candidatus Paceibacterota bacterium]|jgi:adenylate kinase
MEKPIIFFIGKPGSGKGTQAKLLADITGWKTFTTGGQFRALSAEDTAVGRKVKEVNDAGLLQPYWLASYLYLKTLLSVGIDEGIIFDGVGRKLPEAEIVTESLKWLGRSNYIFYLHVLDDEVHKRIDLRREKESRQDDNAVDKRLEEYHASTEMAIDLYRKTGMLTEIDGQRPPEVIAEEIKRILKL